MKRDARRAAAWVVLLGITVLGFTLIAILRGPWLGLQLQAQTGGEARVRAATGPAQALLKKGDGIVALRQTEGAWVSLGAADLNPEPSYLVRYTDLEAFFARQGTLHAALSGPQVQLMRADGHVLTLTPARWRDPRTLPAHVWVQFAFMALVLAVIGTALTRAPRDLAAYMLLAMGLGVVNCICAHTIYSARELAISAEWFRFLIGLNHASALALCGGGGNAVLWLFPRPLAPRRVIWVFIAVGVGLAVAGEARLAPTLNLGFRLPLMAMIVGTVVIPAIQWRRAVNSPLHRAMLRWWVLPWIVGLGLYTALLMIPSAAGGSPATSQTLGWLFLTLIFFGLGLGVTRFRLFYLNPANLWVWGVTGGICAALLIALRELVADPLLAACGGLAVAGIAYFPVRELIWRVQPHQRARLEHVLELIASRAVGTASLSSVIRGWRQTLIEVFRPLEVHSAPAAAVGVTLIDEETLVAALAAPGDQLTLRRPFAGRSLYSPEDAALAQAIGSLYSGMARYWELHEQGEQRERERIASLLRSTLSQRIGAMRRGAVSAESIALIDQIEARLDSILTVLGTRPCALREAVARWRARFLEACGAAGIAASVRSQVQASEVQLNEYQMIACNRMVDEAATNIVRHSQAGSARLTVRYGQGRLDLIAEDDGHAEPDTLPQGRGLRGLAERCRGLGGTLELSVSNMGGLCVHQSFAVEPLESEARPAFLAPGEGAGSVPRSGDTPPLWPA